MINLEQIQALEKKINNAVELISILKRENNALKRTIDSSQKRVQDLESLVNQFKNEQFEIEKSILSALTKLDELEDNIVETDSAETPADETETQADVLEEKNQPIKQDEPVEETDNSNTLFREPVENESEDTNEGIILASEEENESGDEMTETEKEIENELDIF